MLSGGAGAVLKEGQRTTNVPFGIESHLAGFYLTVTAHTDDLTSPRRRIERIERRFDFAVTPDS